MTRKLIKDLKPGDMVSQQDGTAIKVTNVWRNPLFEGNAMMIETAGGGQTMASGDDEIELAAQ